MNHINYDKPLYLERGFPAVTWVIRSPRTLPYQDHASPHHPWRKSSQEECLSRLERPWTPMLRMRLCGPSWSIFWWISRKPWQHPLEEYQSKWVVDWQLSIKTINTVRQCVTTGLVTCLCFFRSRWVAAWYFFSLGNSLCKNFLISKIEINDRLKDFARFGFQQVFSFCCAEISFLELSNPFLAPSPSKKITHYSVQP